MTTMITGVKAGSFNLSVEFASTLTRSTYFPFLLIDYCQLVHEKNNTKSIGEGHNETS